MWSSFGKVSGLPKHHSILYRHIHHSADALKFRMQASHLPAIACALNIAPESYPVRYLRLRGWRDCRVAGVRYGVKAWQLEIFTKQGFERGFDSVIPRLGLIKKRMGSRDDGVAGVSLDLRGGRERGVFGPFIVGLCMSTG